MELAKNETEDPVLNGYIFGIEDLFLANALSKIYVTEAVTDFHCPLLHMYMHVVVSLTTNHLAKN